MYSENTNIQNIISLVDWYRLRKERRVPKNNMMNELEVNGRGEYHLYYFSTRVDMIKN
jgi:hypothetical protein